jgi:hypothetical protein
MSISEQDLRDRVFQFWMKVTPQHRMATSFGAG